MEVVTNIWVELYLFSAPTNSESQDPIPEFAGNPFLIVSCKITSSTAEAMNETCSSNLALLTCELNTFH